MDPRRLRTGEALAGAAGLVLLVDLFLTWYENVAVLHGRGTYAPLDTTANAWQSFAAIDLWLALTALVAIALAALTASQHSPAIPLATSVAVTFVGGVASVLVLYRLVNEPGADRLIDVRYGAFIGLMACVAITAGGWIAMRDEAAGTSPADQRPLPPAEPVPPPA